MDANDIPFYVSHPGTVRIAGHTEALSAAKCALHFLGHAITPIDFFYVGANAGQQAMKAMGIMRYIVESTTQQKATVIFQPNRVRTEVAQGAQTGAPQIIDAVYWRAFLVDNEELAKLVISYGKHDIPSFAKTAASRDSGLG